jgi:hypothetical protein
MPGVGPSGDSPNTGRHVHQGIRLLAQGAGREDLSHAVAPPSPRQAPCSDLHAPLGLQATADSLGHDTSEGECGMPRAGATKASITGYRPECLGTYRPEALD